MRLKTFAEIFLLIAIIGLQIQIWYSQDGFAKLIHLKTQQEQTHAAIAKLDQANAALTREIIGLKYDKHAIEEHMRYELGVIKQGETFFLMTDK